MKFIKYKKYSLAIMMLMASLNIFTPVLASESFSEHGPVWMTWYARVDDEKMDDYLNFVSTVYRHKIAAWKKAGLLHDFKMLTSKPGSEDDWNVAFVYIYKNMAALDVEGEEWSKAAKKVIERFEADDETSKMLHEYEKWRKFIGWSKPSRELVFK